VRTTVVVANAVAGDIDGAAGIDTRFSSDRIYRVRRSGLGFSIMEERVEPPIEKTYALPTVHPSDRLYVARIGDEVVGLGELAFESWNGRARIEHLYVTAAHRGRGIGRELLQALENRARGEPGIRCLWLETQNVNHPAIHFYRRLGFRLCGLDETLYRTADEVALFFARELGGSASV
jgi:ribosomal protein S18 acetylase RimI-like enzyme